MRSRLVATTLSFALTSSVAPLALGEEPPPEAKRAFADGKAAYDRGDYETALLAFERAEQLAPAPSLFYNIGMAYERLGRYGESAGSFDRYLAQVGPPRSEEERAAQAKVRERAAADRARAQTGAPVYTPPPSYAEPPPLPPPGYAPYYYYAPYGQPGMTLLSREERIRIAHHQRTSGIVLVAMSGVFLVSGITLVCVSATTGDYGVGLGTGVAGALMLIGSISLGIPGGILLAKGQKALNAEQRTPDDSAATRRSALDLAAPGVLLARPSMSFAIPPIRF